MDTNSSSHTFVSALPRALYISTICWFRCTLHYVFQSSVFSCFCISCAPPLGAKAQEWQRSETQCTQNYVTQVNLVQGNSVTAESSTVDSAFLSPRHPVTMTGQEESWDFTLSSLGCHKLLTAPQDLALSPPPQGRSCHQFFRPAGNAFMGWLWSVNHVHLSKPYLMNYCFKFT